MATLFILQQLAVGLFAQMHKLSEARDSISIIARAPLWNADPAQKERLANKTRRVCAMYYVHSPKRDSSANFGRLFGKWEIGCFLVALSESFSHVCVCAKKWERESRKWRSNYPESIVSVCPREGICCLCVCGLWGAYLWLLLLKSKNSMCQHWWCRLASHSWIETKLDMFNELRCGTIRRIDIHRCGLVEDFWIWHLIEQVHWLTTVLNSPDHADYKNI